MVQSGYVAKERVEGTGVSTSSNDVVMFFKKSRKLSYRKNTEKTFSFGIFCPSNVLRIRKK